MFKSVYDCLNKGEIIGIFPEGYKFKIRGSHDNPDLLPIKAGICIMALGN